MHGEELRSLPASLVDFFCQVVSPRLGNHPNILEIGCGSYSLFEEVSVHESKVLAIDYSATAIAKAPTASHGSKIQYKLMDISQENLGFFSLFDLVFDSHCFHCLMDEKERAQAFVNVFCSLAEGGIFCAEMMVQKPHHKTSIPYKNIKEAREIEEEITRSGLKICYFMIHSHLSFTHRIGESEIESDVLRVIARK